VADDEDDGERIAVEPDPSADHLSPMDLERQLAELRRQTLQHPVQLSGLTVTELNYQPLRGRHMRQIPASEDWNVGILLDVAAALSTQPHRLFDLMHPDDVREVCQRMARFLAPGRATGGATTPS